MAKRKLTRETLKGLGSPGGRRTSARPVWPTEALTAPNRSLRKCSAPTETAAGRSNTVRPRHFPATDAMRHHVTELCVVASALVAPTISPAARVASLPRTSPSAREIVLASAGAIGGVDRLAAVRE